MKSFFSNRAVIAIIFFVLGGSLIWTMSHNTRKITKLGLDRIQTAETPEQFYDELFNEYFVRNPGAEAQDFEKWYLQKFGGVASGDIKRHDDAQFVYYDIEIKGPPPQVVNVEIRNQQVYISAEAESKQQSRGTSSVERSQFQRSFPVPENVDAENYKMEREPNRIHLKFPKKQL